MIKAKELLKEFNITRQTLYNWRKKGMPCTKLINGLYQYDVEQIKKWLQS
jgi:predicted site-specific integrase-resolvase